MSDALPRLAPPGLPAPNRRQTLFCRTDCSAARVAGKAESLTLEAHVRLCPTYRQASAKPRSFFVEKKGPTDVMFGSAHTGKPSVIVGLSLRGGLWGLGSQSLQLHRPAHFSNPLPKRSQLQEGRGRSAQTSSSCAAVLVCPCLVPQKKMLKEPELSQVEKGRPGDLADTFEH